MNTSLTENNKLLLSGKVCNRIILNEEGKYFTDALSPELEMPGNVKSDTGLILIPFEYKQSALFHLYTYEVIDSVVAILLKNKAITLSIEGFAHVNEGSDTICYYLSLNRALFVRDYVVGRGVDSSRIISLKSFGNRRPYYKGIDKNGLKLNCRVELKMNYPKPPTKAELQDRDADGIPDLKDNCPDKYGYIENSGCPDSNFVIIPFETQLSSIQSKSYKILDSVITLLRRNPAITIFIKGHAYKDEGINSVCDLLAKERAAIVKNYLLSRYIPISRIVAVNGFGNHRPLNAGRNAMEILKNARAEIFILKQ